MSQELQGWSRQVVTLIGIILAGAAAAFAVPYLVSARGAIGPSILQAQSVPVAAFAMFLAFGLGTVVAVVIGRWTNAVVGLGVLGCGLVVVAHRSATMGELVFAQGSLGLVALETVIWAAMILVVTVVVFRVCGVPADIQPRDGSDAIDPPLSASGISALACGVLTLVIVSIVAQTLTGGQVMMTAIVAGLVVGLAGRLIAPHANPMLLFIAPVAFGAAGHLTMAMRLGAFNGEQLTDVLPALARVRPIDYAVGSLLGIAMGLGWARSFLHFEDPITDLRSVLDTLVKRGTDDVKSNGAVAAHAIGLDSGGHLRTLDCPADVAADPDPEASKIAADVGRWVGRTRLRAGGFALPLPSPPEHPEVTRFLVVTCHYRGEAHWTTVTARPGRDGRHPNLDDVTIEKLNVPM